MVKTNCYLFQCRFLHHRLHEVIVYVLILLLYCSFLSVSAR